MLETRHGWHIGVSLAALLVTALLSTRASAAPAEQAQGHAEAREPMVFDLVRGLGARRGEVEANTLLRYEIAESRLRWAPELEIVLLDGLALELELPTHGVELEAIKLAGQVSFPRRHERFGDGFQAIIEIPLGMHPTQVSGLYLASMRFDRVSMLAMVGARVEAESAHQVPLAGLSNFAVFVDIDARTSVGIELDGVIGSRSAVLAMPQLHLQLSDRLRIQGGIGMGWSTSTGVGVVFGLRMILE